MVYALSLQSSWASARSVARRGLNWKGALALTAALLLSACAGKEAPPVTAPTPVTPQVDSSRWLTPRHMQGDVVRVAILLPTGASAPEVRSLAQAMLDAAQLALFDQGSDNFLLMPKDTKGTTEGAAAAAREALDEGAEIILGPLFAQDVAAVAPIARDRNVPVIAFSTDSSVASNGVYLLSFLPDNELDTIARYATSQGLMTYAALIPEGAYGTRVAQLFNQSLSQYGGVLVAQESYPRDTSGVTGPVRRLARDTDRTAAVELEKQRLREAGDEASLQALARLESQRSGASFQAVLIPEEGNLLRSLAPLLAYNAVDPRRVRYLGTGLWDDPEIAREPSLLGGWFAAPAPEARQSFAMSYRKAYGHMPPRIASLAYDGVMLAATLSDGTRGDRFTRDEITDPNGFFGVDGLFRFLADGRSQRGLAVIEVTREGFQVVNPAPTSFEQLGF